MPCPRRAYELWLAVARTLRLARFRDERHCRSLRGARLALLEESKALAGHQFRAGLRDTDPDARAYLVGELMRQAKPDEVFTFVRLAEIIELWPRLEKFLGHSAPMWRWLLEHWREDNDGGE